MLPSEIAAVVAARSPELLDRVIRKGLARPLGCSTDEAGGSHRVSTLAMLTSRPATLERGLRSYIANP